jgi:hypothetical protein
MGFGMHQRSESDLTWWQGIRRGPARHWLIPILLLVVPGVLWWVNQDVYWWITKEDRLAEWGTFAAYVAAIAFGVGVVLRLRRARMSVETLVWVAIVVAFVYIAGEEISWAQRIFHYGGPSALVAANSQHEANTHNLVGRHVLDAAYIVLGLIGAVGARWVVPRIPRLRDRPWLFVPPARYAPWFLCVAGYYIWFDYIDEIILHTVGWGYSLNQIERLQETAEMSLGIGLALFAWSVLAQVRAGRIEAPLTEHRADDSGTTNIASSVGVKGPLPPG